MKILIVDTCGATGSVVLADAGGDAPILATRTLPGRSASERLVATIKELMAERGLGLDALGAVAVVHGPGSFTGVRVGLSAAKGLCEALNLPLIAVSRLAMLAEAVRGRHVFALLDAGRGEFYLGEYDDGVCVREALLDLAQVFEAGKAQFRGDVGAVVVACEAAVAEAVSLLAPSLVGEPSAVDAWRLVLRRVQAAAFDDVALIDANYLRRTDAELFARPRLAVLPDAPVQ